MNKRGLCSIDDKRFLLEDGIQSLAYGHYNIPARIHEIDADEVGNDIVLTADQAHSTRIPLQNRTSIPDGFDPVRSIGEAEAIRAATLASQHSPQAHARSAELEEPDLLSYLIDDS